MLLCAGALAGCRSTQARTRGRPAGVLELLLVLDDVRGRHWHRHADVRNRRTPLSLCGKSQHDHRTHGGKHRQQRTCSLRLVVHALGHLRLGRLCDRGAGAGFLRLPARPAADHQIGAHAALRQTARRSAGSRRRRCGGRRDRAWCLSDPGLRRRAVHRGTLANWRRRLAVQHERRRRPVRIDRRADLRAGHHHGRVDPLGTLGGWPRDQVAVQHQYGSELLAAHVLSGIRLDGLRPDRLVRRDVGLPPVDSRNPVHGLARRRHRDGQQPGVLAGRLDDLLLGMVDRVCAVCRCVPRPYFERPDDS